MRGRVQQASSNPLPPFRCIPLPRRRHSRREVAPEGTLQTLGIPYQLLLGCRPTQRAVDLSLDRAAERDPDQVYDLASEPLEVTVDLEYLTKECVERNCNAVFVFVFAYLAQTRFGGRSSIEQVTGWVEKPEIGFVKKQSY